jgi:hypothetical protein
MVRLAVDEKAASEPEQPCRQTGRAVDPRAARRPLARRPVVHFSPLIHRLPSGPVMNHHPATPVPMRVRDAGLKMIIRLAPDHAESRLSAHRTIDGAQAGLAVHLRASLCQCCSRPPLRRGKDVIPCPPMPYEDSWRSIRRPKAARILPESAWNSALRKAGATDACRSRAQNRVRTSCR